MTKKMKPYEFGMPISAEDEAKMGPLQATVPPFDSYAHGFNVGFRAGTKAMREAAAKHIQGGRALLDIQYTPEFIRGADPALVVRFITADAEAATRHRIVQVIRALPLPEPAK